MIGVVGYPGDKRYDEENGAQMYQEFQKVKWNLDTAAEKMLEYRISTYIGKKQYLMRKENQYPK